MITQETTAVVHIADALAASTVLRSLVMPVLMPLMLAASLACTFFLVTAGIEYMTSRGKPENLEHAKQTISHALLGLVVVIAAAAITALLVHSYTMSAAAGTSSLPTLAPLQENSSSSFWDIVIKTIVHVLAAIIQSIGQPLIQALAYFTTSTPLVGTNPSVFNLWLVIVGIADVLFVLVVALLGFHLMSFTTLGFDELDLRQLAPQLVITFLAINTSLFMIDAIITLSNDMLQALAAAFPPLSLWDLLVNLTQQSAGLDLGGLLIMIAFLILTVILLVYYVGRLITLYLGAVLSPLVLLLYILPAFKDFAITAAKIYLSTVFVLFVQVVIMQLAASTFLGVLQGSTNGQPNTLMALIVGLATLIALLKTQGVMKELSYVASTPRAARHMATTFLRSVSYLQRQEHQSTSPPMINPRPPLRPAHGNDRPSGLRSVVWVTNEVARSLPRRSHPPATTDSSTEPLATHPHVEGAGA